MGNVFGSSTTTQKERKRFNLLYEKSMKEIDLDGKVETISALSTQNSGLSVQLNKFEGFEKAKKMNMNKAIVSLFGSSKKLKSGITNKDLVINNHIEKEIDKPDKRLYSKSNSLDFQAIPNIKHIRSQLQSNSNDSSVSFDNEDLYNLSYVNESNFKLKEEVEDFIAINQKLQKIPTINVNLENHRQNLSNSLITSYYTKILYFQSIRQTESNNKPYNTVIILDWDDTLLCSTYLFPYISSNVFELSKEDSKYLKHLENFVFQLLCFCIDKGDTYIVTNASTGWVEMSASVFIPEITKLLPKINIQSARDNFERLLPGDNRKWKINTFMNIKENYGFNKILNLICIGDSLHELEAAFNLRKEFLEPFIKTIKMQTKPTLIELVKELKVINTSIEDIYNKAKNLTITLDKRKKD